MTSFDPSIEQPTVYRLLFENMTQGFALHEIILDDAQNPVDYRFISVNVAFEQMTGLRREDIIGCTVKVVLPRTEAYWIEIYGKVALTGESQRFQNYSQEVDKHFDVWSFSPQQGQFATVITDITEQKKLEIKLKHVFYHDSMTELYNLQYVHDYIAQLKESQVRPVSVIALDINGLQTLNESFGYLYGDEIVKRVAKAVRHICRPEDIPVRWGGDDFFVIAPNTDEQTALAMTEALQQSLRVDDKDSMSDVCITVGQCTQQDVYSTLLQTVKKAVSILRHNKNKDRHSLQLAPINLILQALGEKNKREELHSQRVSYYCTLIGKGMGLDSEAITKLGIIGLAHDIGKIGIDEGILNKPSRLTPDEYEAIKKHAEIGFRILSASSQTAEIGFYVLSHHERLDGSGYPNGIKGESISLYTRILAVADSFDAMTSKRPYCDAKTQAEAFAELRSCASQKLDATVVEALIAQLEKEAHSECDQQGVRAEG